ncbi:hypothetical protein KSF_091850 [Reticulibacter mediterranei]|uniref:Uncharacterized protein n=1 Tax=Reticulibacter mediterranei TaxID=2778369 RepID=A0A8J3N9B3_9CHLR|nr:hypothetical protein [Reticulibacter mediterranei]GHO99137.1 hypothetical protein KSF_091850 [Reticulibacter mediterranei]
MASAEDHERLQGLIAKVEENRLDIEAAIVVENADDPAETQELLTSFNENLDKLR